MTKIVTAITLPLETAEALRLADELAEAAIESPYSKGMLIQKARAYRKARGLDSSTS